MALYFFDMEDNDKHYVDDTGSEHATREGARSEAIETLAAKVADNLQDGDRHLFAITVREAGGADVFKARFLFHAWWIEA